MAHEALKLIIRAKLPKRESCTAELLALLDGLEREARAYHGSITSMFRRLSPGKQRELLGRDEFKAADMYVRASISKLKERGISLAGMEIADFCEAFIEVYPAWRGKA